MSSNYQQAVERTRNALMQHPMTVNGRDEAAWGQVHATKAVAEAILALAAALRPEPFEVNVKVDATDARAAAEEVVAAHSAQNVRIR